MPEDNIDYLNNDIPVATDNSPQPEDGVQPSEEEINAFILSLNLEEEEEVE